VSNNIKITLHEVFTCAVAILELKKWGGHCGANGKSRGANINIYLAMVFFVVLKNKFV